MRKLISKLRSWCNLDGIEEREAVSFKEDNRGSFIFIGSIGGLIILILVIISILGGCLDACTCGICSRCVGCVTNCLNCFYCGTAK
ncbi:MAG: hypothetical protein ACI4SE_01785 [Lachnospiraceae bacterium]